MTAQAAAAISLIRCGPGDGSGRVDRRASDVLAAMRVVNRSNGTKPDNRLNRQNTANFNVIRKPCLWKTR